MGSQDIDFNDIARRITRLPDLIKPGDMAKLYIALDGLKGLPFPPGYLDEMRTDMLNMLQRGKRIPTYVYLSFYGLDEKASHLKIGIAKDVKNRLGGIKTGNPLPNLWAFTTLLQSRREAEAIEAALLCHMSPDKAHGEWVCVHGVSKIAAEEIVESLAEVAAACHGLPVEFVPYGIRR